MPFRKSENYWFVLKLISSSITNKIQSMQGVSNICLFVCVGVLRPSQQRGHVEPVS